VCVYMREKERDTGSNELWKVDNHHSYHRKDFIKYESMINF
jgi:hypothetical protein